MMSSIPSNSSNHLKALQRVRFKALQLYSLIARQSSGKLDDTNEKNVGL